MRRPAMADFAAAWTRISFTTRRHADAGPGGCTSQSIREAWRKRIRQGLPWGRVAGNADTTEPPSYRAFNRAVRFALDPAALADAVTRNAVPARRHRGGDDRRPGAVLRHAGRGAKFDAAISVS